MPNTVGDGNQTCVITTAINQASTTDNDFDGLDPTALTVTAEDDDGGDPPPPPPVPEFSDYMLILTFLFAGYAMKKRLPELQEIVVKK